MTRPIDPALAEVIKKSPAILLAGEYWYYKAPPELTVPRSNFLAVISDAAETTIVTKVELNFPQRRGPFYLVRLEVIVPFDSPGFLAAVTSALAQCSINVLLLSTFTYDYLLIRAENRDEAIDALQALGLSVTVC